MPETSPVAEAQWLVENGIAETRALLIKNGEVLAAKLVWPGELRAGDIHEAQLTTKASGERRGVATLGSGQDVLVDHLPPTLTEGASFTLRVSRAAIAERGRFKRPLGRYFGESLPKEEAPRPSSHLEGRVVPAFEAGLWEDVWQAASAGSLDFAEGEIVCSATPAMTLVDVDGAGSAKDVSAKAIPAIARALRWFDIGGNTGIDFPTIASKADRRLVDQKLAEALKDWPHERTAMNGFGFVQIVSRLQGPNFLQRFATSRVGLCARAAVRTGERAQGAGPVLELSVHPALKAKLKPEWIEELARRTGKRVQIKTNPGLALEAPQAHILSV